MLISSLQSEWPFERSRCGTTGSLGEAKSQVGAGAELTVQDLTVIRSIIDVASQRGAFKANEMAAVGTTYNKLDGFLKIVEKSQKDATKAPAEGDKEAEKK